MDAQAQSPNDAIDATMDRIRANIDDLYARIAVLSATIMDLMPHVDSPDARERALKAVLENGVTR